ncbi:MAG: thioredoxin domain-containing protein, partial [Alphaproteobacteria bacterium]|nr:thioredoxin domain-containing protein [Alphaproteobacteria bacterium]
MNLLQDETSPYLLQHKDNPVRWRPWGAAAFDAAKAKNLPILLSIGYAACHWCHVMAHESFENEETAALMNAHFICIKLDREERPDLDAAYQTALSLMGKQGGWPLTMFLTPDGRPFWGGTYFPPEPRHGLPAFREILAAIAKSCEKDKDVIA